MSGLIKNEFIKIKSTKKIYLSLVSLFFLILITGLIMNSLISETGDGWEERLIAEQKVQGNNPDDGTTGIYFSADIQHKDYYLENQINPYEWNAWRFSNSLTTNGMDIFLALFILIISSSIISSEYSLKTMKSLVVSPHSRMNILLSKFSVMLILSVVFCVAYYIFTLVVGGFFFGVGDPTYLVVNGGQDNSLYSMDAYKSSLIVLLLRLFSILTIATFAFMMSVLTKSQAVSVSISIFLLFGSSIIGGLEVLTQQLWFLFTLFPHMNLVNYINSEIGNSIEGVNLWGSMLVLVMYCILFIVISITKFKKEDIL